MLRYSASITLIANPTIYIGLHPNADIHRLYIFRKAGGHGLLYVKLMIAVEH